MNYPSVSISPFHLSAPLCLSAPPVCSCFSPLQTALTSPYPAFSPTPYSLPLSELPAHSITCFYHVNSQSPPHPSTLPHFANLTSTCLCYSTLLRLHSQFLYFRKLPPPSLSVLQNHFFIPILLLPSQLRLSTLWAGQPRPLHLLLSTIQRGCRDMAINLRLSVFLPLALIKFYAYFNVNLILIHKRSRYLPFFNSLQQRVIQTRETILIWG